MRRSRLPLILGSALAASALLSGCLAQVEMTISPAGTYSVSMDLRDSTGSVFSADTPAAERCTSLADPSIVGAPKGTSVKATPVGSASEDNGLGCQVTITGVAIPAEGSSSASPLVVRKGDTYVVDLSGPASALVDGSGISDAGASRSSTAPSSAAGSGEEGTSAPSKDPDSTSGSATPDAADRNAASTVQDAVTVKVSVTFPGAVIDAGGGKVSTSGRTVTWEGSEQVAKGLTATGYASTNHGLTFWDRWHNVVAAGAMAAVLAAAGALIWTTRRRRRRRAATASGTRKTGTRKK